jgi:hypothetical protein
LIGPVLLEFEDDLLKSEHVAQAVERWVSPKRVNGEPPQPAPRAVNARNRHLCES